MNATNHPEPGPELPLRERDPFTRLLRARPLLTAALLFLAGCALQFALKPPALPLWVALAVLALAALALCLPANKEAPSARTRRRFAAAVLALMMIPAGMLRFEAAWRAVEPLRERRGAEIAGRICETPEFREGGPRTVCTLDELCVNGITHGGKLLLYLRGDEDALRDVRLGQEIRVTANLWVSDEATNPGQFDLSDYRRARGIRNYATADIADASFTDAPLRLRDLPELVRSALGARIERLFPENAALARALVLGERDGLSETERESYARSGAAHLLAISGMHLSALAMLVSLLLGRFLRRDRAFWLTLGLLLLYGALVGFAPSLVRALMMFAVLGFAPIAGRRSDGPTRLGAALLLHLLIQPTAILNAGFVLSYGATAGILLLGAPLSRLPLLNSALNGRPEFHNPGKRLLRWVASAVVMTLSAQLAILPAVIHNFGAQPLWSLPVNLLAAPLTMLAYVLALPATLLNLAPLAVAADFLFGLLARLVRAFASLPLAQVRVARFPLWLDALCVLLVLASSELARLPRRLRTWLPFAVLLAIPVSNLLAWTSTLGVSVVFLDAGQADCAVIRAQGHVYMIDAGDTYSPAADYLRAMNYTPDALFLTHPHLDHAGGLTDMLAVCAPKRIYLSANWERFEVDAELTEALEQAQSLGSEVVHVSAGDEFALSEDAILRVLSPKAGFAADSANDDSLILRLEYGDARALFLADAPSEVTEGLGGDVDLLKLAHHGARDGTSAALLAETTPSAAVISVGRNNSYGHPAPRVLELLEAAGVKVLRTDRSGAVTCRLSKDGTLRLRGFLPTEDAHGLE